MRILLLFLSIITFILGCFYFIDARTVIDQAQGWLIFLISSVFFIGSAITDGLYSVKRELLLLRQPPEETIPSREEIETNNEKNAHVDAVKAPSVGSSVHSKFLKSSNVSKAEVDAIARLEADGFTVKKYAIGTTSVYWKCVNDSLVFTARTVDELILYSEQ